MKVFYFSYIILYSSSFFAQASLFIESRCAKTVVNKMFELMSKVRVDADAETQRFYRNLLIKKLDNSGIVVLLETIKLDMKLQLTNMLVAQV
jgi:hypothetical protein